MDILRSIIESIWFYLWNLAGWITVLMVAVGFFLARLKWRWPGVLMIVLCFLWCTAVGGSGWAFYTVLDPTPLDKFFEALIVLSHYLCFNIPAFVLLLIFILCRRRRRQ